MTTGTRRKPPVLGPEPWSDVAGRPWSHWDLWFVAVTVSDHDGSFDDLEARLVAQLGSHVGRQGAESKLSHLADLRARLEAAGLSAAYLATPEVLADKRVLARARKKVSDDWVGGRAMTGQGPQAHDFSRGSRAFPLPGGEATRMVVSPACYDYPCRPRTKVGPFGDTEATAAGLAVAAPRAFLRRQARR